MRHLSVLVEVYVLRRHILVGEELVDARFPRVEAVEHPLYSAFILLLLLYSLLGKRLVSGLLRLIVGTERHDAAHQERHSQHHDAQKRTQLPRRNTPEQHHHEYH